MTNKEDLISRIRLDKVRYFNGIPKDMRTKEVAAIWLESRHGDLHEIPVELITDRMRQFSISRDPRTIRLIRDWHTSNYYKLALQAVTIDNCALIDVESGYITEQFLMDALKRNPMALYEIVTTIDVEDNVLTSKVLNYGLTVNHDYLKWYTDGMMGMVSNDAISAAIRLPGCNFLLLEDLNKAHLLEKSVVDGFWPKDKRKKPKDAAEAVSLLMKSKKPSDVCLYKSSLKLFPTGEVVKLMTRSPTRRFMLEKLYSASELVPHLSSRYNELKGELLERDLGI